MRKLLPTSIVLAWFTFLAGGTFFALMIPLGEGFDETWHFAYIQHVTQRGRPPLGPATHISREIAAFLESQPVSWGLHRNFPTLQSYEDFWRDSEARQSQDRRLAGLRFGSEYVETPSTASALYESHQPPLYYFLMAPVFAAASRFASFEGVFRATRIVSVVLASLLVPGSFFLARAVLRDAIAASQVTALVVIFPGLYPAIARVSNDALAVPLACWTLLCLVLFLESRERPYLYGLAILVGMGLWTKAFFIPIVAAIVFCLLYYRETRAALTIIFASLIAVPWYFSNLMHTGSITGLPETVGTGSSLLSSIDALRKIDWENLFNVVRFSHIWVGNWSFLNVRGWMYQVIFWLFVLGVAGLIRGRVAAPRALFALAVCYITFMAALVYYATQVFQEAGTSVAEGWYLTSFTVVEAVLFTAGIQSLLDRHWRVAMIIAEIFLVVLLVYTSAFVELPYYAGITFHKADGALMTYHPRLSDFSLMSDRLLRFRSLLPPVFPWLLLSCFPIFCFYSIFAGISKRRWAYPTCPTGR